MYWYRLQIKWEIKKKLEKHGRTPIKIISNRVRDGGGDVGWIRKWRVLVSTKVNMRRP
jgi:hypothetical protein